MPYLASEAQKKWAGKYGTLSEALGKMTEYYKYDDSGKHEAGQMLDFEKRRRDTLQRQGTAPPAIGNTNAPASNQQQASGQTGAGKSGDTYVSHITIPGLGTAKFGFDDAQEQRNGEDLLRKLAQAKGASI